MERKSTTTDLRVFRNRGLGEEEKTPEVLGKGIGGPFLGEGKRALEGVGHRPPH